jgi:hypothetical protein
MRTIRIATVVSSVLLASAAAYAGDSATKEKWSAADTDRDGQLTLAEARAGMPAVADKFASIDANGDGKISGDEFRAYHKASGDKSMEADEAKAPTTSQ